jgi:hypothetical protein
LRALDGHSGAPRELRTVSGRNPSRICRAEQGTLASRGLETVPRRNPDSLTNHHSRRRTTMKRNLIAVILATLATAAFAEPTLQGDENRLMSAPEATSYIAADVRVEQDDRYQVFNP